MALRVNKRPNGAASFSRVDAPPCFSPPSTPVACTPVAVLPGTRGTRRSLLQRSSLYREEACTLVSLRKHAFTGKLSPTHYIGKELLGPRSSLVLGTVRNDHGLVSIFQHMVYTLLEKACCVFGGRAFVHMLLLFLSLHDCPVRGG